ncbi:hypothetical protein HDG38_005469 [Paraburkholderia sp. WSM4177]|nr:hypothetical protein [Paraburkholderia sp. WSM4177]MBB5487298.1 hypothetical protein [Paraburkholderia sp. WSM4180]
MGMIDSSDIATLNLGLLRCPLLQGEASLAIVSVSVVYSFDAGELVIQTHLRNVAADP